jgi:hypothetical protein
MNDLFPLCAQEIDISACFLLQFVMELNFWFEIKFEEAEKNTVLLMNN